MDVQRKTIRNWTHFGIQCGLVGAVFYIVYAVVEVAFERQHEVSIFKFVFPALVLLATVFSAIRKFKRSQGQVNLMEAVKIGVLVAVLSSVLIVSYELIYTNLIEPDYYERYYEINREAFFETHSERHPGMTWEQFEIDMQEGKDALWKVQYTLIFMLHGVVGLVVSVITGLAMRRK